MTHPVTAYWDRVRALEMLAEHDDTIPHTMRQTLLTVITARPASPERDADWVELVEAVVTRAAVATGALGFRELNPDAPFRTWQDAYDSVEDRCVGVCRRLLDGGQ